MTKGKPMEFSYNNLKFIFSFINVVDKILFKGFYFVRPNILSVFLSNRYIKTLLIFHVRINIALKKTLVFFLDLKLINVFILFYFNSN